MSSLDMNYWLRLLAILAGEVAGVIAVVLVVQCFVRSGVGRRSLWRIGVGCLLMVIACELTGFGRGLVMWGRSAPPALPVVSRKVTAEASTIRGSDLNSMYTAFAAGAFERSWAKVEVAKKVWWPVWIWLAGFILVTGRLLVARVFMGMLRRRSGEIRGTDLNVRVGEIQRRMQGQGEVRLRAAKGLVCPVAFGILRPTIVFPEKFLERFSREQQDAMLTHELAHLAARDPLWYLLADLASALLWWHPVVWWARRQLHNSSELAADEATAILPDGPQTLAVCLVGLGRELSGVRNWGWLGVGGNGFRSSLGRRVERLLCLTGSVAVNDGGKKSWVMKAAGGIVLASLMVTGAGWLESEGQAGDWSYAWNSSPAAVVLLAAVEKKPEAVEAGPEVKKTDVLPPPIPMEKLSPKQLEERQMEKVDLVAFSNTELNEALRTMTYQRKSTGCVDPGMICDSPEAEKAVINIHVWHARVCGNEILDAIVKGSSKPIEYTVYSNVVVFSAKDGHGNGMFTRQYSVDVSGTNAVKVLLEAAEKVGVDLKAAGKNVFYSEREKRLLVRTTLREHAVVKDLLERGLIQQKMNGLNVPAEQRTTDTNKLYSRTYRVDPQIFGEALDKLEGYASVALTNRTMSRNIVVSNYLTKAGVSFEIPGKMVFYNDRNGLLLSRATLPDLEIISQAVEVLNVEMKQLIIEAKFFELDENKGKSTMREVFTSAFDMKAGESAQVAGRATVRGKYLGSLPDETHVSGIFTPGMMRVVEKWAEHRSDVEVLATPKVITRNGRQSHVSVSDTVNIRTNNNDAKAIMSVPVGVSLDVIPEVSVDGFSIHLTVIGGVTEILNPAGEKWKKSSSELPVPKKWDLYASGNVWDGQTLAVGSLVSKDKSGRVKNIYVFVTPHLSEPTGAFTHGEEDLEFAENTIPPQGK